jgi:hypothetical protein
MVTDIENLIKKYKEKYGHAYVTLDPEMIAYQEIIEDLQKLKPVTIKGHSIEEVITILKALDLERILDIKMTMSNLTILANKLQEDFNNSIKETIERQVKHFSDNVVIGRGNTKNE